MVQLVAATWRACFPATGSGATACSTDSVPSVRTTRARPSKAVSDDGGGIDRWGRLRGLRRTPVQLQYHVDVRVVVHGRSGPGQPLFRA